MHADLVKLLDLQSKDATRRGRGSAAAGAEGRGRRARRGRAARPGRARRGPSGRGRGRPPPGRAGGQGRELPRCSRTGGCSGSRRCAIPKEASTLMAELDLARSVMAKEENEWVRSAEAVTALERKVGEEESKVAAVDLEQAPERARLEERRLRARGRARGGRPAAGGERRADRQAAPDPLRPPAALARDATWWCPSSAAPAAPATPPSRSTAAARSGAAPSSTAARAAARSCTRPTAAGSA